MLDNHIRPILENPLNIAAKQLIKYKFSANKVTLIGFIFGIFAMIFIAFEFYKIALIFIIINRILDGLDGTIARLSKPTQLGGFLDIVCDFIFYAGIVFAYATAKPENAFWACYLIFSFVGTGTTFLAYAITTNNSNTTENKINKAFYYIGGLTEGFETILVFVLFCIFPDYFKVLAIIFGSLCFITTFTRIYAGYKNFSR